MSNDEMIDARPPSPTAHPREAYALTPAQFAVNEVWVAFMLAEKPVETDQGEIWVVGLMDAASTFVFGPALISKKATPAQAEELASKLMAAGLAEIHRLGRTHPRTLLVQQGSRAEVLISAAYRAGITVVAVTRASLMPIIGDALLDLSDGIETLRTARQG